MEPRELVPGDVVQIDPAFSSRFAACLMIVTEPKPWGAQGAVVCPDAPQSSTAYMRVTWAGMEYVGTAAWKQRERDNDERPV